VWGPRRVAICAPCVRVLLANLSEEGIEGFNPEIRNVDALPNAAVIESFGLDGSEQSPTHDAKDHALDQIPGASDLDGCSFCGFAPTVARRLFATSRGGHIIRDNCVALCAETLDAEEEPTS
jgi:hypothetical protein